MPGMPDMPDMSRPAPAEEGAASGGEAGACPAWCPTCPTMAALFASACIGALAHLMSFQGKFKLLINFGQVISMVPIGLAVLWPESFYRFLDGFDFLNFDLFSIVSFDCAVGFKSFLTSFYTSLALPVVISLVNGASFFARARTWRPKDAVRKGKLKRAAYDTLVSQHLYVEFMGLFLIYPSVSADMMRIFRCDLVTSRSRNCRLLTTHDHCRCMERTC